VTQILPHSTIFITNQKSIMTQQQVIDLMNSATSESDWNDKCDQVKDACQGYPSFWYSSTILSGLASKVQAKW